MKLAQKIAINYIRAKLNILAVVSKKKAAKKAFEIFCTPYQRSKKKSPPVFDKAEKLSFLLDNKLVKGFRWNQGGSRKILVCHGFESTCINFDRYISGLIKHNCEVIAFDAPAHGKSEGKRINIPMYVDLLRKINQNYGPIEGFLGHSFGGLAISHYLETLEDNELIRTVLIAPATESVRAIDNFFNQLQLDSEVRKEFDDLITRANNKPPSWYSVSRAAEHVKAQVLFLQDKNDLQTPYSDVVPIMKKNLPNFRFVISEGLGHSKIYREPETVNTVMEFL